MCSQHSPLGTKTIFYHIEFQQWGNPHIHGLLWLEDTPKSVKHKNEEIYAYNDKIVSCSTDISQELHYVLLQKHKHSRTCMKVSNGQKTCQYGAPWPPMHATIYLEPLDVDENAQREVYV